MCAQHFFRGRKHANIGSHFVAPPPLFIATNFKFLCRIEGERDLSFLSPSLCLFRRDFLDIFVKKTETENDKTRPPPSEPPVLVSIGQWVHS